MLIVSYGFKNQASVLSMKSHFSSRSAEVSLLWRDHISAKLSVGKNPHVKHSSALPHSQAERCPSKLGFVAVFFEEQKQLVV